MADSDDPKPEAPPRDLALAVGPTERGDGVTIVRLREGQRLEVGELRAAAPGKPILGESVRLHARAEDPRLFEVETVAVGPLAQAAAARAAAASGPAAGGASDPCAAARPAARSKGPAQVASEAYRTGWESIFGGPRPGRSLPS